MSRVLAIRPEPGLASTMALGRELGLEIAGQALFEIRPLPWDAPNPDGVDALLVGSANAFLHGGEALARFREKPVHAVGQATADAARGAGFFVATVGTGGLQRVLKQIAPPSRLLRIAGAEHVPLEVPESITVETVIAYESVPLPLDARSLDRDETYIIVLLHSAAAARHFAKECKRLDVDRGGIALAALGPRIASAAGKGWRAIHVAQRPDDRHLLEMVREMCI